VLGALRGADIALTAIVGIAKEADGEAEALRRLTGEGVGDLRRSLEALGDEEVALLRAIRRQLDVEGLGQYPLGNLALAAAADALGDYGQASMWLGDQLGIDGAVLPSTIEPGQRTLEMVEQKPPISAPTGAVRQVRRLRFLGERTESPQPAITAIREAAWVLLAPGALYRDLLSAAAAPDLVAALPETPARVVWIANLHADVDETPNLSAIEQLLLLRLHGVRVDVALHDPSASLALDPAELEAAGVESVARPLRSAADPALHDPDQLRLVLAELLDTRRT
jgi:uncharacterized cofD-like protein